MRLIEIPRSILGYDNDKKHIIANQVDIIKMDKLADEDAQLVNPEKINYWIIEVEKDILHGPLGSLEFVALRVNLGVSEKLKF